MLYSTVLIVNVLMLFVVFPMTANLASAQPVNPNGQISGMQEITLNVDIPCSGHASLIIYNLKNAGVEAKFLGNNNFLLKYDVSKISKEQIMSLDVFKEFKAKEVIV